MVVEVGVEMEEVTRGFGDEQKVEERKVLRVGGTLSPNSSEGRDHERFLSVRIFTFLPFSHEIYALFPPHFCPYDTTQHVSS